MDLMRMPADYDRLPEFRKLVAAVGVSERPSVASELPSVGEWERCHPLHAASLIWLELWCALTYETAGGHEAGNFTQDSAVLQLTPEKIELLLAAGVLIGAPIPRLADSPVQFSYTCPVFARYNKHLSPNYEPVTKKGNRHSTVSRRIPMLTHEAQEQMMLLPSEVCQRADGVAMTPDERKAAMSTIKNIDNILNRRHREIFDYSAGLMADALEFFMRFPNDAARREMLLWLSDHIGHASLPKTAEQILANVESVLAFKRSEDLKERQKI